MKHDNHSRARCRAWRLTATGLLLALASGVAAAPESCLQVDNHRLTESNTRYGITTATWSARVENHCGEPYGATLTVQFLDTDSEVLYRAVEIVTLQPEEATRAEKRVNLDEEKYTRIVDIRVDVEERRRPR